MAEKRGLSDQGIIAVLLAAMMLLFFIIAIIFAFFIDEDAETGQNLTIIDTTNRNAGINSCTNCTEENITIIQEFNETKNNTAANITINQTSFNNTDPEINLIDWPDSDERLDYGPKVDNYISVYKPYFDNYDNGLLLIPTHQMLKEKTGSATAGFVDQYNPDFHSNYDAKIHYERFLEFFLDRNPDAAVGTYISGGYCRFDNENVYPISTLDCDLFSEDAFLFGVYDNNTKRIDIRNEQYKKIFQDSILNEAEQRNRPFLYIDNIVHPQTGGWGDIEIEWEEITGFLEVIKNRLNEKGIKTVVNVAGLPWTWAEGNFRDADLLSRSVDGFSFEQPFHWRIARSNLELVQQEISVYRKWLEGEKLILFIPVIPSSGNYKTGQGEVRVLAALTMMFRERGDSIFISRIYWRPSGEFEWKDWPGQFGRPIEEANFSEIANGWKAERKFENGKIRLIQLAVNRNSSVNFTLPEGSEQYSLIIPNNLGSLDMNNYPEVVYAYDNSSQGVDSAMFARDHGGEFYSDVLIVSFSLV